jgi:hypothetical protein
MTDSHSLPQHYGWMIFITALILLFPALGTMLESQSIEIWDKKVEQMGILYTVGSLFWSFVTWIFLFYLLALGVESIRCKDKSVTD